MPSTPVSKQPEPLQESTQPGAFQDAFDPEHFLRTLTTKPGVYRMFDGKGQVVYVGKAKNLKRRVSSYFRDGHLLTPKTRALMQSAKNVTVTVTHTETEALLLENNLIKEYRPRYNIVLRDDKSYPYIYVTTHQRYPRLTFHRGARRKVGRYFGPYPSAAAVRETLNLLQKLFLVRQCADSFFSNRSRPCLQYQIQRCTGPCVELVPTDAYAEDVRHAIMFLEGKSEAVIDELVARMETASKSLDFEFAARYRDQIQSLRRIQERQYVGGAKGDIDVVAATCRDGIAVVQVFLIRDGQNLGNRTYFPKNTAGASVEDVLTAFLPQYYLAGPADRVIPSDILVNSTLAQLDLLEVALTERATRRVSIATKPRGPRARWVDMAQANADIALAQHLTSRSTIRDQYEALQEALEMPEMPERVECFDISHTQGEATVASCVVFDNEGAVKSDYRRFNIRDITPGDDYAAMEQALTRRYSRVQREEARLPDLVVIDGGKGQLTQAIDVFERLQISGIAIIGIAKGPSRKAGLENIIIPGKATPVQLPQDSPALLLLQRIRDEAHRFAITGHRARRTRARKTSRLEEIPGVGAVIRQRLLTEFGGIQGVQRAGIEDLSRVRGVSRDLAQNVYDAFRGG
ncbi:MAG: excinuclease ABC subunit C [Gammaproteobacteria bacterium]|jgi:excinuclease ABC subunit C